MSYIKATNPDEQEMFDYLEDLRQSGHTNMFGAGPYLQQAFGIERADAHRIMSEWMKAHDDPARKLDAPISREKTTVNIRTVVDVKRKSR